MKLRTEDNVIVIRGKDTGKQGSITKVYPKNRKAIVEGANVVVRHAKASGTSRQSEIINKEMPLHVSSLALICTNCNNPTKVKSKILADGSRARICSRKECGEVIE